MLDRVRGNLSAPAARLALELSWGDLMVLGSTVTSSVNVVAVKLALANCGPLTYGSIRFLLGGAALCVIARWREGPMPRPRARDVWMIVITAGIGEAISQALFTTTLTFANVDYVAMVQATSPLLIVAWLAWREREHFGLRVWIGFGLGVAGAALALTAGGGGRTSFLDIALPLGLPVTSVVYVLMLPLLKQIPSPIRNSLLVFSGRIGMNLWQSSHTNTGKREGVRSARQKSTGWPRKNLYTSGWLSKAPFPS